jgi:NitT/TauT family transport system substrate-binding protein
MRHRMLHVVGILLAIVLGGCGDRGASDPKVLRFGHFPNVTHAHGLVAHLRTTQGKGWFESKLGDGVRVEWRVFNAGPSAMQAMSAGSLDVTYAGPNPALNMHFVSKGDEVRVLAGATRGGSALLVQGDGRIKEPKDFRGRRVATPQLGNTQDVACRAWLKAQGFAVTLAGGDVEVRPIANPEILSLFSRGEFDAAWTVEPWVSRLETEAKGKVFLDEPDAVTTILVSSSRFLKERPEMAKGLVAAHAELTAWLRDHPDEARAEVRAALKEQAKMDLTEAVATSAFKRMRFDTAISRDDFEALVTSARSVDLLPDAIPLDRFLGTP